MLNCHEGAEILRFFDISVYLICSTRVGRYMSMHASISKTHALLMSMSMGYPAKTTLISINAFLSEGIFMCASKKHIRSTPIVTPFSYVSTKSLLEIALLP